MKQKPTKQIIIGIIAAVLIIIIIANLFPVMKELGTREGQLAFQEKVASTGIWGMLALFGLQFSQIFLVILPGEPIEILAGMCYGTWGGMLYILASVAIITTFMVLLVRKYGKKCIYTVFDKKKIDKIEKSKFFRNKKTIEMLMIVLFMIPGTPKDLLTYIGGILPIQPLRFICIATFARFPSVISSTMVGANLSEGDWTVSIIIYAITFVVTGIFLWLVHKLDKNKITQKAMETLK